MKPIFVAFLITLASFSSDAGVVQVPRYDTALDAVGNVSTHAEVEFLGGRILFATDDFFAVAENLLLPWEAIDYIENYTVFGKKMDGWETRRRRIEGHDWAIIALDEPSTIEKFLVDTAFYTGNFPPLFSIQAALLPKIAGSKFPPRNGKIGTAASEEALKKMAALRTHKWKTIVPNSKLKAGLPETRLSSFDVNSTEFFTHLRLNIYPDGGIARLRIYGKPCRERVRLAQLFGSTEMIDLIEKKNGGVPEGSSNNHYGNPWNLIKGGKGPAMTDGWETARQPNRPLALVKSPSGLLEMPVKDWVIIRLGKPGIVETVIVDTTHYKGNSPYCVEVMGAYVRGNNSALNHENWITILPQKLLSPNTEHVYTYEEVENVGPFTHVKMIIAPDGGIMRFKVLGYVEK